jgi:carbon-monoxide dehydrogenase large subunit
MTTPDSSRLIGKRVTRLEDAALLRGRGRFVGDIAPTGLLHAAFVRSPHAHALIDKINTEAAQALPGVHAVYTAADFAPHLTQARIPVGMPSGAIRHVLDPEVLTSREVCHVGEAIALVVADSRAIAEDAAALVEIDFTVLPAVVDPVRGLDGAAPKAREDCADNLAAAFRVNYGDCDSAFARAAVTVEEHFELHKGGGHAIEGRAVLAEYNDVLDQLVVFDGTQMPHRAKALICDVLGLAEHRVRVIAPDVGGGFGPKFVFYPEEIAIPLAAVLLKRPVRWLEDGFERFVASTQERDQVWNMTAATDADGRLLAVRGTLIHDHGAYTPYGVALPGNSATNFIGPYVLPAFDLDIKLVMTNKIPATPTRGAGRPQGTFVMERLLDRLAEKIGIARDEIRRRNLIGPEQMPYVTGVKTRDGGTMTYDTGDYPRCQAAALDKAGWRDFVERQKQARAQGRYIGIGFSNYVEGTGRGPFEAASVRINASGRVVVTTGATAQGQGVATMLAQVCADELGVDIGMIDVIAGDTDASAVGLGAFASRQAATAGPAVQKASRLVKEKILAAASSQLEVAPSDLVLRNGRVEVAGAPGSGTTLGAVARSLRGMPGFALPAALDPGLHADAVFSVNAITYSNGCHVAEVEVDPATGAVKILRYSVVHDCGTLINPMMVEGQIIGGVVHGIGQALYEWMRFSDDGQPLTTQYADYLLPIADSVPPIDITHFESPTPLNPLGVKGAGESGTIPAAAAIASAVENALAPFGVRITQLPMTPARIRQAIERAAQKN